MLDEIDVLALAGFIFFGFWGITDRENFKIRRDYRREGFFYPPSWVFGVVWPLLYACISVSGFYFWRTHVDTWYFIGLAFFAAAKVLNRYWTPVYVSGMVGVALGMIALMQVFGVVYLLAAIFKSDEGFAWVAAGTYIPLLVWQAYAFLLNWNETRQTDGIVLVQV